MTLPLVPRPGVSTICAGCDGQMVITHDAVGNERLRCPRCHGVARPRRHPDDAMLPQGLVRATDAPVRIIRQVVRVEVPSPPERIVELPPIRAGQLRCQVCGRGVMNAERFCREPSCIAEGQRLIEALRLVRVERVHRRQSSKPGERHPRQYASKLCAARGCNELFVPTGPAAKYCEAHR